MKRMYACLAIFVVILALTLFSGRAVRDFERETTARLSDAQSALCQSDAEQALQIIHRCAADFRRREHLLSVFVRRDSLSALDVTLSAAQIYTQEQNIEEALAELRRAESQVYAISHLFFRLL